MASTTGKRLDVNVRWMIRRDMPEVLQIEAKSFEFPWTEEDFFSVLRERNVIGMISETGNKLVGFMIYELLKWERHVLNFAVDPEYRLRGVGRQMADKLISKLSQQRRSAITLEVRESNLVAQQFWRRMQFRATGVIHGHYEDTPEDAYQFEYWI